MAAKVSVTLQALENTASSAALKMHKCSLKLSHLPHVGDFIKDPDIGYAEVVRVVFDTDGDITLVIK